MYRQLPHDSSKTGVSRFLHYCRLPHKGIRHSPGQGVRFVALLEGTKGLLILLLIVGCALLTCFHNDIHTATLQVITYLHLTPSSHYPKTFLHLIDHLDTSKLWCLALIAALYSAIHLVEASGLWLRKTWAEWFTTLSGGIYIPFEIYSVVQHATWLRITILTVNVGIVSFLLLVLWRNGKKNSCQNPLHH